MSKRRSAREFTLKVLFQIEVGKMPPEEALATSFEEVGPPEEERDFITDAVRGVVRETQAVDRIIGELAEGWRLDRLAKVDKNVLRLALYELIHHPERPANVVVNDAVEVAKKYSTEDSGKFVNGILGGFLRRAHPAVEEQEVELSAR